jgi:hypothetical protein
MYSFFSICFDHDPTSNPGVLTIDIIVLVICILDVIMPFVLTISEYRCDIIV